MNWAKDFGGYSVVGHSQGGAVSVRIHRFQHKDHQLLVEHSYFSLMVLIYSELLLGWIGQSYRRTQSPNPWRTFPGRHQTVSSNG